MKIPKKIHKIAVVNQFPEMKFRFNPRNTFGNARVDYFAGNARADYFAGNDSRLNQLFRASMLSVRKYFVSHSDSSESKLLLTPRSE